LRVHCVSRPKCENFARFLHDYRSFQTHCVSRLLPGYFRQRVALKRRAARTLDAHALAKPALAVVVRVLRVPCCARAPMSLASALIATARALSLASTRVRLEPLAANPTRPLARHHCLLKRRQRGPARSGRYSCAVHAGWVTFREQRRVTFRER
jgi:hypothetical protein